MIYKTICTFRIFSSSASLEEIEALLKIKSTGGYRKGDPISLKNRNSKLRNDTLWTLDVQQVSEAGEDASELLDKTLAELLLKIDGLTDKVSESSCDISIALFSENEQINCFLSKTTLKRLAMTNVDVLISGFTGHSA